MVKGSFRGGGFCEGKDDYKITQTHARKERERDEVDTEKHGKGRELNNIKQGKAQMGNCRNEKYHQRAVRLFDKQGKRTKTREKEGERELFCDVMEFLPNKRDLLLDCCDGIF